MIEEKNMVSRSGLEPSEKRFTIWDSEISGFGVRWATIGTYDALTPDQARESARRWASDVANGGDPASTRVEWRQTPTISELMDLYFTEHVAKKNNASTERNARLLAKKLICPKLGHLKVADVTIGDVARLHNANAKTRYQANRALAVLSKAFGLAEV